MFDRPADALLQIFHPAHLVGPFGERLRHARQIVPEHGFRKLAALALVARRDDEWGAGPLDVVEHAHGVAETGCDVEIHHAHAAGGVCVAFSRADGDGLLEAEDVVEPALVHQRVHEGKFGGARIAENAADTLVDECFQEQVRAVTAIHAFSLTRNF